MGSDWPVSTPDPLAAIHTAVTRTTYGEEGRVGHEPFLPEQALDLTTAFAAYTRGSAWVNHRDDAGVIEPGAVADLVVLDRDPFAGPVAEIGAARVAFDLGRRGRPSARQLTWRGSAQLVLGVLLEVGADPVVARSPATAPASAARR